MIGDLYKKRYFISLLLVWFLINLLQAHFTEINPDEAYYFLYGKHLSWGYFDHPPMVALLVHTSSWLFTQNLGVRFTTVLLQIPALVLIWLQLDKRNYDKQTVLLFFIICGSTAMFCVYGFITTPDAPLLFFTCLFLYGYKNFLEKNDWAHALIISIAMAGLVYSKYQGVLVIAFVILSNFRLLANAKFWIAAILALALYTPHFYWQYINGLPSIKYHLVQRSGSFKWRHLIEYLPNLLVTFNPFTLGAVAYVLIKYKPAQKFEKALYAIIVGFILFFWIATIRGHAQPQWTVAAAIPMIILLNNKIVTDNKLRNYVQKYVAASLLLVLAARLVIITGFLLPESLDLSGKKPRYQAIEKIAKDNPVIFNGSYQEPALYSFFTGKPATTISSLKSRLTQFDIWRPEQNWINDTVFIVNPATAKTNHYITAVKGFEINGLFADNIQIPNRFKIDFQINNAAYKAGDSVRVKFTIENPTQYDINFDHDNFPVEIIAVMKIRKNLFEIRGRLSQEITILKSKTRIDNEIKFVVPAMPQGDYQFALSCSSLFGPSINSAYKKITVYQ